ncbi:MAG TPA: MFS transporter [Solirubrobacteraceae bacterium]|nr:MFS transporter [Solirubrobacteraceae bacterium]
MPSALSSPRLRRIIAAYTVNRLGTWIAEIALSLAVFDHTHSALAVSATLVAAQVLPAFAVPPLVAKVEASRRRRELSGLYFFEAISTLALAGILLWRFSLPAVLLLVALDGTAALTASALLRTEAARAGRDALVASAAVGGAGEGVPADGPHVGEQRANAAINVAFSVTFVLGPVLGGVITGGAGAPAALLVGAVGFLVCGTLLVDLHARVEEARGESVRARLGAAWGYVSGAPTLRAILFAQAVAFIFFAAGQPIEVAYAKATLQVGDRGFGLLVTVWGGGTVVGALVFARAQRQPLGAMVSIGTLAVGLAYVGFAAAPSLAPACAAALVGGIGNGIQWAPLVSAVQRLTPPHLQGRVMGGLESIGALCPALGLALGGALVALSSSREAFLIVGSGAAFTTAAFASVMLSDASALESALDGGGIAAAGADDGNLPAEMHPSTP